MDKKKDDGIPRTIKPFTLETHDVPALLKRIRRDKTFASSTGSLNSGEDGVEDRAKNPKSLESSINFNFLDSSTGVILEVRESGSTIDEAVPSTNKPKSLRDRAADILSLKGKKGVVYHESIDALNSKGLTSKHLKTFGTPSAVQDPQPTAQKHTRPSILTPSLSLKKSPSFMSELSFSQTSSHTGYKPGRPPSIIPGNIETASIIGEIRGPLSPESAGTLYSAMSAVRSTRISLMLARTGVSPDGISPIDITKLFPSVPKQFKEFYISLLLGRSTLKN